MKTSIYIYAGEARQVQIVRTLSSGTLKSLDDLATELGEGYSHVFTRYSSGGRRAYAALLHFSGPILREYLTATSKLAASIGEVLRSHPKSARSIQRAAYVYDSETKKYEIDAKVHEDQKDVLEKIAAESVDLLSKNTGKGYLPLDVEDHYNIYREKDMDRLGRPVMCWELLSTMNKDVWRKAVLDDWEAAIHDGVDSE